MRKERGLETRMTTRKSCRTIRLMKQKPGEPKAPELPAAVAFSIMLLVLTAKDLADSPGFPDTHKKIQSSVQSLARSS